MKEIEGVKTEYTNLRQEISGIQAAQKVSLYNYIGQKKIHVPVPVLSGVIVIVVVAIFKEHKRETVE